MRYAHAGLNTQTHTGRMDNLFDIRTVAICNAAASYVLSFTLASARSRLVEIRGIRDFALAAALSGTSFVIFAFQGAAYSVLAHTVVAVPMMTLAVGLMYAGACKFTGKPSPMKWVLLSVAAIFFLTLASNFDARLLPWRLVLFSMIGAAWSLFAGMHVLRHVDKDLGFGRVIGAVAMLAISFTFVIRAVALFVVEIDPDPLGNSLTNRAAFFIGTVLMMLALAGAASMVNTRIGLEIASIAERDVLTGVLSRFGLKHASAQWTAQHDDGHLLLIDLDHFKQVNDALGHDRGDDVLRMFTDLANSVLPTDAVLARYGGDEFVMLLPFEIEPEYFGLCLIEEFDERINVFLNTERRLTKLPSLSIGIARIKGVFGTAIRDADRALYRAKSAGRSRIATWSGVVEPALKDDSFKDINIRQEAIELSASASTRNTSSP
jgi:diguanylate cyclase (GGDEF)-like protein